MLAPSLFVEDVVRRSPSRQVPSGGAATGRTRDPSGWRRRIRRGRIGFPSGAGPASVRRRRPPASMRSRSPRSIGQFSMASCDFARSPRSRHATVEVADRDGQVPARAGGYVCAVRSASRLSLWCGRPRHLVKIGAKSDEPTRAGRRRGSEGLRRLDDISIWLEVRNAAPASRIRPSLTAACASRVLPAPDSNETVVGAVLAAGGTRCSRSSQG
jgi:hypothetical protein